MVQCTIKAMQLAHDLLVTGLVPHPRLSYPKMVKAVLGLYNTLHVTIVLHFDQCSHAVGIITPNHTILCTSCSCTAVQFVVHFTMVTVVTASNLTKTILHWYICYYGNNI